MKQEHIAQPGAVIDSRYQLLDRIGEGGMCSVWEAQRLEDGGFVAIKLLQPDLEEDSAIVTRFLREAAVAEAGRRSPHILSISESINRPNGSPALVMELLDGADLRDLLNNEGRLEPARAASLLAQVCDAVAELHGQGITHRDLKPENVFVCHDEFGAEEVKLLDFGIAQFKVSPDEHPASLGDSGTSSCTPHYAAPELLYQCGLADHRIDVYALGVMLYELLTGTRPFRCQGAFDTWMELTFETPKPPRELRPEIPEGLEAVILRAMEKAPEDRFAAVDDFAEALAPFVGPSIKERDTLIDGLSSDLHAALLEAVNVGSMATKRC